MDLECKVCLTGGSKHKGLKPGDKCPYCPTGILERQKTWNELTDALPEKFWCRRRGENPASMSMFPEQDHWDKIKSTGDRVCSYCGSLHPDDFFPIVKAASEADPNIVDGSVPEIEVSDKSYKIYIHRPGVRNAHEGAIKFYTMHLPRTEDGKINVTEEQQAEFRKAQDVFSKRLKLRFTRTSTLFNKPQ